MSNITVHENLVQEALREAIEKIKAGIDLEKTKRIIQERFGVGSIEKIDLQEMRAVAHEGQIAFRCAMTLSSDIAILLDSHGRLIEAFPEKGGLGGPVD
jgi:O-acetylhomoserine/O-acetylserine sulfhydrylase-like pyridoxal-dependent enzyme